MAVAVIAIHTHPLENCTISIVIKLYNGFTACAVPFFFLSTGYLLAVRQEWPYTSCRSIEALSRYLKKTIKVYLLWSVIYLPLEIAHYLQSGKSFLHEIASYVRGLLFVGEHYNSWVLWYLLSTIYALCFILFLLKHRVSMERIALIGVGCILLGTGLTAFANCDAELPQCLALVRRLIVLSIGNGRILSGMFYIPCGMLLARKTLPAAINVFLFFSTFFVGSIVESAAVSSCLAILCAVSFFGVIERWKLNDSAIYPKLRMMSKVFYFMHLYVWTIYYVMVYGQKTYGADCFFVTLAVCTLISLMCIARKSPLESRKRR